MRQWYGIPKRLLCTKHLGGTHVEQHMAVGSERRGIPLGKLFDNGWIDPGRIREEHDEAAAEIQRRHELTGRGGGHKSPMERVDPPPSNNQSKMRHLFELVRRCPKCHANLRAGEWLGN